MARTKLRPQQRLQQQRQQLQNLMNRPLPPAPTIQGRTPIHSGGVGVKQVGLRKDKKWKIKQKIPNS